MGTIVKHNELVRKAIEYIYEHKRESDTPLPKLLQEAGMRFNLSPLEMQALERHFKEDNEKS